jgi:hypothetical protein
LSGQKRATPASSETVVRSVGRERVRRLSTFTMLLRGLSLFSKSTAVTKYSSAGTPVSWKELEMVEPISPKLPLPIRAYTYHWSIAGSESNSHWSRIPAGADPVPTGSRK